MRWANRYPWLTSLILVVLIIAPGYWRLEQNVNESERLSQQACEDRRTGRLILRELVELSDDGQGGFNLTGIASYNDLDPATQKYLADLEAASKQAPRPSEFVESALELLDVPDCN